MTIKLTAKDANKSGYLAYWENGVYIGDVDMDIDGYYKYFPSGNGGYFDEWFLGSMFQTLKSLNKA